MKQKLEHKFSESWKADPNFIWGMKLHNNPLTHQTTPADYILHYMESVHDEGGIINSFLRAVLVECKQVTCEPGENGRLAFNRLKQMHDLLSYQSICNAHKAFFCIAFKESRWDHSDIYLIPAEEMNTLINSEPTLSITRLQMLVKMPEYQIQLCDNTLLNLSKIYL